MARLRILADHWFDGVSLRNDPVSIEIEGERIGRIEATPDVARSTSADGRTLIDARGKLLAPGLVNAHVHIARGGCSTPKSHLASPRQRTTCATRSLPA